MESNQLLPVSSRQLPQYHLFAASVGDERSIDFEAWATEQAGRMMCLPTANHKGKVFPLHCCQVFPKGEEEQREKTLGGRGLKGEGRGKLAYRRQLHHPIRWHLPHLGAPITWSKPSPYRPSGLLWRWIRVLRGLDCFTLAGIAAIWHHTERGIWEIVPHIPQLAPSSFSKPIKDSPCSTTPH